MTDDIRLCVSSFRSDEQALVHLSAVSADRHERYRANICLIIDVSGSMQLPAALKDHEAAAQLSILDVVVHSCRTVIQSLSVQDMIGIVTYSDKATAVLPLTAMDENGKLAAEEALRKLRADGQTNLWDGLQTGLDMLHAGRRAGTMSSALLLTDGVPNVEPAGGHLAAIESYRRKAGGKLPCTLHTFGFGYDLNSQLLDELAEVGGGLYVFIPDAGFVGTALVNCCANSVTTAGRNARLVLHLNEGIRLHQCCAYRVGRDESNACIIHLGSIQLGQTKDVVVCVDRAPAGSLLLRAELLYDGPETEGRAEAEARAAEPGVSTECRIQCCRLQLVDAIVSFLRLERSEAARKASQILDELRKAQAEVGAEARLTGLIDDVSGQVAEALSRQDWYESWGIHYLRSLARAHLAQLCNNFKDPGVQCYGGEIFHEVRDAADDIFLKLPPPDPASQDSVELLQAMGFSEEEVRRALDYAHNDAETAATYLMEGLPLHRPPPAHSGAGSPARRAPAVDMSMYYDASGG
mmetsp:Transcript_38618/g.86341  ORF Transcript_38618/g.86341 Transcript_38618/m.86341 type:complete len:523 (-) Transcript_38618:55-1623(-)